MELAEIITQQATYVKNSNVSVERNVSFMKRTGLYKIDEE